ncbi:Schnurri [Strongyloides ratti]|uniref:Schnurri n=1 Tax=Strongyloides ratti TaxID=34506 RepID=A0A090KYF2_STRRB|nr:Schnurri [Strongyloides ratti]CEF62471.1 Schnurri [Strongyloides ratti]
MSFISNEGLGSNHPSIQLNQNQDFSALLNSGQVSGNLLTSLNNGSTLLQPTNNNQHTLNDLSTIFFQQQLLSQLQQNSGNGSQSSFIGTGNGQVGNIITNTNSSNNATIYQQLLNQQHQQQQQQQNSLLLNAAAAQNQQPSLSQLLQLQQAQAQVQNQLQNCGNLQNSSLQTQNIPQYNSAFKTQTPIPQPTQQQGNINPTLLQQLINAGVSPTILAKLISGNSQPTNQINYSPATATQTNLLLQQQLHLANQPQMQQNLQQQINKMIEAHKQQQLAEKRAMEERHMLNQLLAAANQSNTVNVSLSLPFPTGNNNITQQLQGLSTEEETQKLIKEYMLKQSSGGLSTPLITQKNHQQLQQQQQHQTPQVLVSAGNGLINGLQHQSLLQQPSQQLSATINLPQSISIPQSTSSTTPLPKDPNSVQLLKDPKFVTNHIQQIINRNEEIIEQSPVLARRRPYYRQPSNTSILDSQMTNSSNRSSFSDKESPTNQINSGGIEFNQTINSNSIDSSIRQTSSIEMVNNIPVTSLPSGTSNGSLTNGQPFIRNLDKIHPRGFACEFCNLLFPNKAGLQAHSFRCSRNEEGESSIKDSSINSGNVVSSANISLSNNNNNDNDIPSSTLTINSNPLKQQENDNKCSSNLTTQSSLIGNSLKRSFPTIDFMAEDVIKNLPFKIFKMKDLRQMSEQSFSEFAAEAKNIIPAIDQGLLKPGDDENVLIELRTKMLKHAIKKAADYDTNIDENTWSNLLKSNNNNIQQQTSSGDLIQQPIPNIIDETKNDNNNKINDINNIVRNNGLLSDNDTINQPLIDTLSLSPSTHQNIKTAVETAVSYVRQNVSSHMPYAVTINNLPTENDGNKNLNDSQDGRNSLSGKHRLRNITSETYLCLNTIPVHEEQLDTQSSFFSKWKVPQPEDNNFSQYLKSCNLKTRTGNKNTYEYTTAKGDINCLKMTHSTYWYQSKSINDKNIKKDSSEDSCIKEVVELIPVTEENKKQEISIQPTSNGYTLSSNISPTTSESSEKSFTITKPPPTSNDNSKRIRIESSNGLAGYKTDEVYVYVRGRGRGRYVCERCGIRCKKPSMLKKHLNSHTDIRPFKCIQCSFSFKTKGNLTKHLLSKAHSRKLAEQKSGIELPDQPTTSYNNVLFCDEGQLQIITEDPSEAADIVKMGKHEAAFMNIDNESDDDDENRNAPVYERNIYRKYGQEVIIQDRRAHTPPSLWCNPVVPEDTPTWGEPEFNRSCQSAPPASFSENDVEVDEDNKKQQDFQRTIQRIRNESMSMTSFLDDKSFANTNNIIIRENNKHQNSCSIKNNINDGNNEYQTNGQINNIKLNVSNNLTTTNDSFLVKDVNEYACDICEKKFRKEQEWILHQHTHTIEKNSHRVKNYYCPKCRTCTRSKTSMIKHIEAFHTLNASNIKNLFLDKLGNGDDISMSGHVSPNENSSNSSTSSTPTYNINNGSRTFLCNDCNKGFRTHGVLAKHLRSQQHITKMSILGKLNEDQTCALRRNPHCLTKVDTKDCDAARQSIISKANEILEDERNGTMPVMTVIATDNK